MPLTDEQILTRRNGIGGSDAAAACGLSRWRTPLDVYLEKRGEAPAFEGNEFTKWGVYLEPAIRQEYANQTGRPVRLPEGTVVHPVHDFMLCHPDGVTDDGRLFEAKNTRFGDGWGEPGTDQIPVEYLMQVQHSMLVTGLVVADVAVLIGGCDFRIYTVAADADLHALLIKCERELWGRIKAGMPPNPQTVNDLVTLYGPTSETRKVEASPEIVQLLATLNLARAQNAEMAEQVARAEFQIKAAMGPADTLVHAGQTLATWKSTARIGKDGNPVRVFKVKE